MVAMQEKRPKNHFFCIFGLLSYKYNLHQVGLEFRQLFDILVHPTSHPGLGSSPGTLWWIWCPRVCGQRGGDDEDEGDGGGAGRGHGSLWGGVELRFHHQGHQGTAKFSGIQGGWNSSPASSLPPPHKEWRHPQPQEQGGGHERRQLRGGTPSLSTPHQEWGFLLIWNLKGSWASRLTGLKLYELVNLRQKLVFDEDIFECLMRCWCLRPEVKFTSCAVSSVWRYCPFLSICGIYENNLNKVFGLQSVWQSRPTEVVMHMLCKACSWALV